MYPNCVFCQIVTHELPSWKLYEDEDFIGILDKFPNVINRGQSLIVSKQHHNSYFADIDDTLLKKAIIVARIISKKLDTRLGSMRTGFVLEGMEIDHFHIKLYPLYKSTYPNFISTYKDNNNKGIEATDEQLNILLEQIQSAN